MSCTQKINSSTCLPLAKEEPLRTLMEVPYILGEDWITMVTKSLQRLLNSKWTFLHDLDEATLDDYESVMEFFVPEHE